MARSVKNLRLKDLIALGKRFNISTLCSQLAQLPLPNTFRIGFKSYSIPSNIDQLKTNICWGQRLFMTSQANNDFETFVYLTACFYQPIVDKKQYDDILAIRFYKRLLRCKMIELYPITMHLYGLLNQIIEIENKTLSTKITKEMRAAEVDRLSKFSEFNVLKKLANETGCKLENAHLTSYNIAFTILWESKEHDEFVERYNEILKASQTKSKSNAKG